MRSMTTTVRRFRQAGFLSAAVIVVCLLLTIPTPPLKVDDGGESAAFVWNRDAYWKQLESDFRQARITGCDSLQGVITDRLRGFEGAVASVDSTNQTADSLIFTEIMQRQFELAPLLAACPSRLAEFVTVTNQLRVSLKACAREWDLKDPAVRRLMYRVLYGSRLAVEEILLQAEASSIDPLQRITDEPSSTPSAEMMGITMHSGDILLSRGGAPTSALIARGNDYPGNFSHIAFVHVDSTTGRISIIESHIEIGVAIATPQAYFADKKLRVMVLRLRSDMPKLIADPLLPHRAATAALHRARTEHITYDFEMDYSDSQKLFCSEVVSHPYHEVGIDLWMGVSRISTPGVRSWLAAFGVKHFETQSPSDLEYDPQLVVVAEWRDGEALYQDHVDNAILDAMLERAEQGQQLIYDWYLLPLGRIMKAYSFVMNVFGAVGPIPEGMDAAAALKNDHFSQWHRRVKARVLAEAKTFELRTVTVRHTGNWSTWPGRP